MGPALPRPVVARDGAEPLHARVPPGRVVELGAAVPGGRLTLAAGFVREAQRAGEPAAWVQPEGAGLYPPDLAAAGVSLDHLVVVHAPRAAAPASVARGAELLLRSGGFGLVVLDLCEAAPRGESWLARLGGLARRHGARVVLLTSSDARSPSAGALVAVRAEPLRRRAPGGYLVTPRLHRDRCALGDSVAPTAHRAPWEV